MSKYQGYPYVNPIVNDVPTIDPATASQYAHLPRKPLQPPRPPPPTNTGAGSSRENLASPTESRPSTNQKKPEDDDPPVVYIDLPSPGESDICTSIQTPSREPEYVQNTFLYDPFDNKRIDMPRREEAGSSSSYSSGNDRSFPTSNSSRPPTQASSSRGPYDAQQSGSRPTPPQSLPGFMEKESLIYGGHSSNEFPLSPIPISEFPEPPPAYTEVAPPTKTTTTPQSPTPTPEPPRTQVIVPNPEPILSAEVLDQYNPNNRKFLRCQHCNSNVHTLVVKENGTITYIIAIILFCIFMPLVLFACCSDCLKEKTHYCPNCNKRIGYEIPVIGSNLHFEKPSNGLY